MNEPTETPPSSPAVPRADAGPDHGVLARLHTWLGSTRAPHVLVALSLLMTSFVLTLDLTADDYIHLVGVRGEPVAGLTLQPWDLFAFARGDAASARGLMDEGVFPWWSDPHTVIAFFRPLSSLTHWLDYALWPEQLALIHLHSLLWFAALLLVVARLYRRLASSPVIASLALWIYALDDARAPAAGWVATRNLLIAMTFALLALDAHVRARSEGHTPSKWLAPMWLGLGFLGGESAVQACCYLFAYALFLERGSLRARLWTLVPYGVVLVLWRVPYSLLGHGARGSGLYFDPGREPLAFLDALSTRLPVLLLSEFATPASDLWDALPAIAPGWQGVMLAWALLIIAIMAVLLAPILRRDARARFWALGALLSTIPVCAGPIDDRLLIGPGIGFGALLAQLFLEVYRGTHPSTRRIKCGVATLAVFHLLLSPLLLPVRAYSIDTFESYMQRADVSIPKDTSVTEQSVVIINPPIDLFAMYFPFYRAAHNVPRPKYLRWLANGVSALDIERLDAHSLRVRPTAGFMANSTQLMLRGTRNPMRVGEVVTLSDAQITVTALTDDQRPAEMVVRFNVPLESPSLHFLQWDKQAYVPFALPKIGETVHVPRVDMAEALFGD